MLLLLLLIVLQLASDTVALDFRNVNLKSLEPQITVKNANNQQPSGYVNPYGELRQYFSTQMPNFPISALTNGFNFTAEQLAMLGIQPEVPTNEESIGLTLGQSIAQNFAASQQGAAFHSYNNNNNGNDGGQNAQYGQQFNNQNLVAQLSTIAPQLAKGNTPMGPTTTISTTPFIWTTTKKAPAKLSKLSTKNETASSPNSKVKTAAHISVPSHRLLSDILVIPSSRRLYILAILPIHESADNKGFDCGRVDTNGFIRLAAFLDALNQVNGGRTLKDAGLSLGAVIVDSCTSDLRTVADLYELLSGTNIQKSDLVAIVRDDGSYLPNVDDFARHLKIPIINTFFTRREQPLTTGTLPSLNSPLEAVLDLLVHTDSSCISVLSDDLYKDAVISLSELAANRNICIEQRLTIEGGIKSAEAVVRRLLLTEARVAIILLSEDNWINLMKAFKNEMVIAGRFILVTIQDPRWQSAKMWTERWPHFDQLLLSIAPRKPPQAMYLHQLTQLFPSFPFPQHWLRQFWSTAFKCHIEGEKVPGEQFSKACSPKQALNLTKIAPDLDVAPIQIAVHSIAHALRKLVDNVCPGALISSLTDCINDPQESLFGAVISSDFSHGLSEGGVLFNETSGYRDQFLVINRVLFDAQLEFDQLATWDSVGGLQYTSPVALIMEERDGTRVPLRSSCPRSACSLELARRSLSGSRPTIRESLESIQLLCYASGATLTMFVCLMCMYQQMVASRTDSYKICTMFSFGGLSILCVSSICFMMPPNALSCTVRRTVFSVGLAATVAPVLVKTLFVWRSDFRRPSASYNTSPMLMFWICAATVVLQIVICVEWAIFESPLDLSFAATVQHGSAWRCSPGGDFESRLLRSCFLSAVMVLLSLVCGIVTVRHVESRQSVLLSLISVLFAVALYIILPLVTFELRDQIMAGAILLFTYLFLLISYCKRAFKRLEDSQIIQEGSLVDKQTLGSLDRDKTINSTAYWISRDALMSPGAQNMTLQRHYHQATTLPHKMPMETLNHPMATLPHPGHKFPVPMNEVYGRTGTLDPNMARRNSIQMQNMGPVRNSQPYGVNAFESNNSSVMPTMQRPQATINNNQGKYGNENYVEESDHL